MIEDLTQQQCTSSCNSLLSVAKPRSAMRNIVFLLYFGFFLSVDSLAMAVPLTDIPPSDIDVPLVAPSLPVSYYFKDTAYLTWDAKTKAAAKEAFNEWDVWLCSGQSFFESTDKGWSIEFVSENYPKDNGWGWDPDRWLAAWDGSEIRINNRWKWYVDLTPQVDTDDIDPITKVFKDGKEFDLLSVLKHEIGHALGIAGDWGQDERFVDKKMVSMTKARSLMIPIVTASTMLARPLWMREMKTANMMKGKGLLM